MHSVTLARNDSKVKVEYKCQKISTNKEPGNVLD